MDILSLPAIYDTAFQFRDAVKTVTFLEECVSMYTEIPIRSVVEFACGTGYYTMEFARRGYATFGVDIDEEMCDYAARKAVSEDLTMQVICGDMVDVALPQPCDLAVNLFDSLTYLKDRQQIVAHLRTVADCLVEGGIYIVEVGVIDDFDNHNVEEIWTEQRRDVCVTANYLRHGIIDPERQTFVEQCAFSAEYGEHAAYILLKSRKLALFFQDVVRLVEHAGCFVPLVYFDDFESDAFLPKDDIPWRVIAVLRKA